MALESTGVYWKPVFYVLEEAMQCLLVNAQHVQKVPGRKTDVQDCVWLAQLLEHGLLRGSFVPPPPQRELRDLTRYRKVLIQERTREANRLHKVLEDAGIKLASVATDILGASGRAMLQALMAGTTDPEILAALARGTLRKKLPALRAALTGRLCPGQNESAGKRKSGRTRPGNRWLRMPLIEAATMAARTRHTAVAARYHRVARHRGLKKAVVAVAHAMLVTAYHLLDRHLDYCEPGADYFDRRHTERATWRAVRALERQGYRVTLERAA